MYLYTQRSCVRRLPRLCDFVLRLRLAPRSRFRSDCQRRVTRSPTTISKLCRSVFPSLPPSPLRARARGRSRFFGQKRGLHLGVRGLEPLLMHGHRNDAPHYLYTHIAVRKHRALFREEGCLFVSLFILRAYYSTLFSICQEVFEKFFNFFHEAQIFKNSSLLFSLISFQVSSSASS